MQSSPLESYLAPARAVTGAWRPLLGFGIVVVLFFVVSIVIAMSWLAVQIVLLGGLQPAVDRLGELTRNPGGPGLVLNFLSFAGIWAGLWAALALLHRQRFSTLFDPAGRVRPWHFGRGLLLALVFSGLSLAVALALVGLPARAQDWSAWAVMLAPLMGLVFVQATAEELFFRGYMLQQLGVRFRSALAWAVIPSVAFGVLHAWNTSGVEAYYYVAITTITGLALAVLVWRTGNLWAAIGMHWGVNMMSLTVVGAEGILSGTQLWLFPAEDLGLLLKINTASSLMLLALVLSPAGRWFLLGRADGGSAAF